jgi:hypothetical protein
MDGPLIHPDAWLLMWGPYCIRGYADKQDAESRMVALVTKNARFAEHLWVARADEAQRGRPAARV